MKKPELIVPARDMETISRLIKAGVDGMIVGDARFILCGLGSFTKESLQEAINLGHGHGKKVYFLVDAIMPNALLDEFHHYLQEIKHLPFDGMRVSDLGAYRLIRQVLPEMKLHLVDGMMLTNYETINYWADRGIHRARLAHELTLDEVVDIKKSTKAEIEVLIHGAPLMFTSRRQLVENYLTFQKQLGKQVTVTEGGQHLYDAERDFYYPIACNPHGTHIYGGSDACMVDDLDALVQVGVDAFYLDNFTYEEEAFIKIVELYRVSIDLVLNDPDRYEQVKRALYMEAERWQSPNRPFDRGFYYKPTIYKNKSGDEHVSSESKLDKNKENA